MLLRRLALAAAAAAAFGGAPAWAQGDPVALCDRVAGSPLDPLRVAPGVSFADMDGPAAQAACRAAVTAQPGNLRAYYQLGRALYGKDSAATRQAHGVAAESGYAAAQTLLGFMEPSAEGGPRDIADARWLFKAAAYAGLPSAKSALGWLVYHGHGGPADPVEGERLPRKAAAAGDPGSLNTMAWFLAVRNGNLSEAQSLAERAVAGDPGQSSYADTLALVLLRRGQPAQAAKQLQWALQLEPDVAGYHDRLGDALAALSRADEARAEWRKALVLPPDDSVDEDLFNRAETERKLAAR